MKVSHLLVGLVLIVGCPRFAVAQPEHFGTSLHSTRAGKEFWYGAANGGFESFTNVPIEDLGCAECHGPTDANGDPYEGEYLASCTDCHQNFPGGPVDQMQCYGCHGRQKAERFALGYSDVHADAGMMCWDCHGTTDSHGDGTAYNSMLEPGAIAVDCEDCHQTLPPEHATYDPHNGALHCASCHQQSVVSCYNCHFDSQVIAHVKRAKQKLHDFVLLANRQKDGKVHPATFQSLTYDNPDTGEYNAFVAFGPYTGHTVTREGRTCDQCHVNMPDGANAAIEEYNETGRICFAQWDDDTKTLDWMRGVIPMPEDYLDTFRMDFITFDGDPHTPAGEDNANWSSIGQYKWDGTQMFFASPLTREQMDKLGFERRCFGDVDGSGSVGMADVLDVLLSWGPCGECCPMDLDDSGAIDMGEVGMILDMWGACFEE